MKRFVIIFSALVFASFGMVSFVEAQQNGNESKIPGAYIVVFKDSVSHSETTGTAMGRAYGLDIAFQYAHVLKGFAATIPDARLSEIVNDPRVAFVSEDHEVYAYGNPQNPGQLKRGGSTLPPPPQPVQVTPTGIARIAGTANENKGAGIGVAVIDTGIDLTHPDLASNIGSASKTCVRGTRSAADDNGHGTHVAGTIAALDNTIGAVGVAPEAKLYAVKVLDKSGSGSWSSIICGIDWVTANTERYNIKVANMSLGGTGSSDDNCGLTNGDPLHQAICRSRDTGVTYVVAAGNGDPVYHNPLNTSGSVPAAYDDAVITVSALADSDGLPGALGSSTSYGADDTFASFSNYGSEVDLAAPGVDILSTWKRGEYAISSGTSMAAPHVAGAVALYVATHPGASLGAITEALRLSGEPLDSGHSNTSLYDHPEPVLQTNTF